MGGWGRVGFSEVFIFNHLVQQLADYYELASVRCCVELSFSLETPFATRHKDLRRWHICQLWAVGPYCANEKLLSSEQEARCDSINVIGRAIKLNVTLATVCSGHQLWVIKGSKAAAMVERGKHVDKT